MDNNNIRAAINALEKSETANFDLTRYDYVLSCRTRLQKTTGKKFSSKINNAAGTVAITRLK